MKKLFFSFIVFLCCSYSLMSQDNTKIVYLNDGTVIRGVTKITNADKRLVNIKSIYGDIFVVNIDEISQVSDDARGYNLSSNSKKTKGYKGFVDAGFSFGVGDYGSDRVEFSTSHGYQFNPFFYFGLGAGLNYFTEGGSNIVSVPIFANPRLIIPTGSFVSPFVDVKIGYTVSEHIQGFYFSPSIGSRFSVGRKNAINLGVGYTMQNIEVDLYRKSSIYNGFIYDRTEIRNIGGITLKLGFEF